MSGASESLARKISGAKDLSSVVRSMKALAASSLGQYERAVTSLQKYYLTVELGLSLCLREMGAEVPGILRVASAPIGLILFGSDQGLVGRFNEVLLEFVLEEVERSSGKVAHVWCVGERMQQLIADSTLASAACTVFPVPYSVEAITPLVGQLIVEAEAARAGGGVDEIRIFHQRPLTAANYQPIAKRLLPLDTLWRRGLMDIPWPTRQLPQIIDGAAAALDGFVQGYLFVILFQASAESLASENASRLAAMQRAEENIASMLENLSRQLHRMRQATIDEELFEVISGYEALAKSISPRR